MINFKSLWLKLGKKKRDFFRNMTIKKLVVVNILVVILMTIFNFVVTSDIFNNLVILSFDREIYLWKEDLNNIETKTYVDVSQKIKAYKNYIAKNPATHERNRLAWVKAEAYRELIKLYIKLEESVDLSGLDDELLLLQPSNYKNYLLIGDFYFSRKDYEKAYKNYDQAFKIFPSDAEIYYKLIDAMSAFGVKEEVVEEVKDVYRNVEHKDTFQLYFGDSSSVFSAKNSVVEKYLYYQSTNWKVHMKIDLKNNELWRKVGIINSLRIDPGMSAYTNYKIVSIVFENASGPVLQFDNFSNWEINAAKIVDKNIIYSLNNDPSLIMRNLNIDPALIDDVVINIEIIVN